MWINPFVAGVLCTIFVEVVLTLTVSLVIYHNSKDDASNNDNY